MSTENTPLASCEPAPKHIQSSSRVIPVKPWCTGKQLPLGFNPMDLGSVNALLLALTGPAGMGHALCVDPEAASVKPQAASRKLQA